MGNKKNTQLFRKYQHIISYIYDSRLYLTILLLIIAHNHGHSSTLMTHELNLKTFPIELKLVNP